jgi:4-amino-4-deoxy-L-arabinose transferase-like glycosyltransferase
MADRRTLLLVLLALAAVPYFVNLGATSIIDANEAFYAETPREMIESGDYISPTFNYEPRLNKPPLSYWVVAAFYHAAGVSLGAARAPIALGAMVMLLTAGLLGRHAFSARAGLIAAVTLAATPRMLLFARRIIIDVYTAMFLGLTLLAFLMAELQPERRRRWLMAMYVAAGLGVLTKGPVAVVVPALVFLAYLGMTRQLGAVRRMMLPAGVLIVAAIVVPYYAALYAQEGWDAIASFLFRENLARYTEGVGAPDRGPLFYLPVVFTDLYFPWSLVLPAALALVPWTAGARARGGDPAGAPAASSALPRARLLLGLWIAVIVAFFSLSNGQQDLYVLPFIVAGAALVGGAVDGWLARTLSPGLDRVVTWSVTAAAAILALIGAAAVWFATVGGASVPLAGVLPAGMLLAGGAAAALAAMTRRARGPAAVLIVGAMVAVQWVLVLRALPDFERYKPIPHAAKAVLELDPGPSAVGTYKIAAPSLVFYLRRHVEEMFTDEDLGRFFATHLDGACVMPADEYERVRTSLTVQTRVIARGPRFDVRLSDVLLRKPLPEVVLVAADRPGPAR